MILRACVKCGLPSPESYCPEHKPKAWANSKRRERMGLSGGAWATVRRRVLKRDMGCCYLCDKPGADEVDHLVELAAGGTNDPNNLASCHAACHRHKHREPEWAGDRVQMALGVLEG